jgi:hypothetical protein
MLGLYAADAVVTVAVIPVHGVPSAQPVPHWLVLLVVVPTLWLCLVGGVLVVDRLFDWLENSPKR